MAFVALISGCASLNAPSESAFPPRESLSDFLLEGRFALRHDDKNYAGRLRWTHEGENDTLLLSTPFGQGLAQISTTADEARLETSDGKVFIANSAEALTNQVLGYPLPLKQLSYWVRGESEVKNDGGNEGGNHLHQLPDSQYDNFGRLYLLNEAGWRIDYSYGTDNPAAPPNQLFAKRNDGTELRLRIDTWAKPPMNSLSELPAN